MTAKVSSLALMPSLKKLAKISYWSDEDEIVKYYEITRDGCQLAKARHAANLLEVLTSTSKRWYVIGWWRLIRRSWSNLSGLVFVVVWYQRYKLQHLIIETWKYLIDHQALLVMLRLLASDGASNEDFRIWYHWLQWHMFKLAVVRPRDNINVMRLATYRQLPAINRYSWMRISAVVFTLIMFRRQNFTY